VTWNLGPSIFFVRKKYWREPNCGPPTIALAILTLFTAALMRRKRSLIIVTRRRAHVHHPHLPLPSQVDCCLFTPLAVGGGVWGHNLPLLFNGLAQLALVVALKMSHLGCGVSACATDVPALPSGQIWPSPATTLRGSSPAFLAGKKSLRTRISTTTSQPFN
jgi:hypothetical protein